MNPNFIKEEIASNKGKRVHITVNKMRNKSDFYDGIIKNIYPHIFTITYNNYEKSFSYHDIITGDIDIKYI